jgi:hypothetical protein
MMTRMPSAPMQLFLRREKIIMTFVVEATTLHVLLSSFTAMAVAAKSAPAFEISTW